MVAISLYRGNLHRVPEVPRRWLMPKPTISLKDFRLLLSKRAKALSCVCSTTAAAATTTTTATPVDAATTTTNPITSNPNPSINPVLKQEEGVGDSGCSKQNHKTAEAALPQSQPTSVNDSEVAPSQQGTVGNAKDRREADGDSRIEQREILDSVPSPAAKSAEAENVCNPQDGIGIVSKELQEEKPVPSAQPTIEVSNNMDVRSDKEKRKVELEEKLQILNEKKHNLVQMLKQIINAEGEMQKRNSMQASILRPSGPLQVDVTVESGSIARNVAPRISSEANFGGDLEEAEDVSNHVTHGRHLHRMRSISPSSASPLRRPVYLQHNVVPHTNRAGLGATGHTQVSPGTLMGVTASPSRFAPSGHQGHPANMPPVSVSGTHYVASSPSPAASGGTSVFRDGGRLTSPSWN